MVARRPIRHFSPVKTRAVAAMDSCFSLIRAHQHGIAVGRSMNGENPRVSKALNCRGEGKGSLIPWIIERLSVSLLSMLILKKKKIQSLSSFSVNVFSTKVYSVETLFLRLLLTNGTAFYTGSSEGTRRSSRLQLRQTFSKTLGIGPAPGIEPKRPPAL